MKKILKMLVLGLLSAALLCCALPSAFAAEDKDSQVYTIGLDAMGGSSSAVAVTTNLSGKLSALPAQPTLEGYTFDGWYTCLLYTSPSPRDGATSRMPSSA